jgi:hypothetical protein
MRALRRGVVVTDGSGGISDEHPAVCAVIERYLRGLLREKDADWADLDVRGAWIPRTDKERAMCARYAREVLADAMHAAHLGAVGRLTLPPGQDGPP